MTQNRTVQAVATELGKLVIRFGDQSTTQVKAAEIADSFPSGGKIKAIQERRRVQTAVRRRFDDKS